MLKRPDQRSDYKKHDPKHFAADAHALRCIAEVAMNVELFTIPLYMNALYSLKGFHQLTFGKSNLYEGRQWPGLEPTADPKTPNEKAFNSVFGVFIQEMFHLELTLNLASAIGVAPDLQRLLLDSDKRWTCYGKCHHEIPFIFDLEDADDPHVKELKVELGPMDRQRLLLFSVIEQPETEAKQSWAKGLRKKHGNAKYLDYRWRKRIPGWTADTPIGELPKFGTIGNLYHYYAYYAGLTYNDGDDRTLFERLFDEQRLGPSGVFQNRMFNSKTQPGHPDKEFPCVDTTFEDFLTGTTPKGKVYERAIWMMSAIVDQGEGSTIVDRREKKGKHRGQSFVQYANVADEFPDVRRRHRADPEAMADNYPSYDDTGKKKPASDDAHARDLFSEDAHYERFVDILKTMLPAPGDAPDPAKHIVTWRDFHDAHEAFEWTADDFVHGTHSPNVDNDPNAPEAIAKAMNRLAAGGGTCKDFEKLSRIANGAMYGVVQSIEQFWTPQDEGRKYDLPLGAMRASFGRFSVMWAIYGRGPDLSCGIGDPDDRSKLFNACRGLSLEGGANDCASPQAYHTCAGANSCMGQGACGTVVTDCKETLQKPLGPCEKPGGIAPLEKLYSAPAGHQCKALGGCAVPISASQRLRINKVAYVDGGDDVSAKMNVYDYEKAGDVFVPSRLAGR